MTTTEKTAKRRAKIDGIPLGRGWSIGGNRRESYITRCADGTWRVDCGWLTPEAYADDPGSVSTLITHLQGRSHAGWTKTVATKEEAVILFLAACDVPIGQEAQHVPPGAERFDTRAG